MAEPPREPLRVCSFESRRAAEMRSLIERFGGVATVAPSMREIPLDDNPRAFEFAEALLAGRVDVVIFMTGVGARALLAAIETRYDRSRFFEALAKCCTIVRGPKPTAVLREWNVRIDHAAPEPNTWSELLGVVDRMSADSGVPMAGKTIAVQEYGEPNDDFYSELERRGATVMPVPVYRWALPDDTGPLEAAVRRTIAGEFDVLMFTSAQQLHNVLAVAESLGLREAWLLAANRCVIASIGPTASETLNTAGLTVDLEPEHPKMGHLVRETMQSAAGRLAAKRG